MELALLQVVGGLAFGALLFVVASGLSLIFGVARVLNLAHGACALLGGYVALSVAELGGPFGAGVAAAGLVGAALGAGLAGLYWRLRDRPGAQLLATLGLAFVLSDLLRLVWGAEVRGVSPPRPLDGPLEVGGLLLPAYPVALLAAAPLLYGALALGLRRTALGVRLRAVTADAAMAGALGVPVRAVWRAAFALGLGLAGVGGALAAPQLALSPTQDARLTLLSLVVVVLGGPGRLAGTLAAALLVGVVQALGAAYAPALAEVGLYALLAAALALRPGGLLAARPGSA